MLTTNISGNDACCGLSAPILAQSAEAAASTKVNPIRERNTGGLFIIVISAFGHVLSQICGEVTWKNAESFTEGNKANKDSILPDLQKPSFLSEP
ncbi:MAG: hypothetical protein DME46_12280 [Verrucomicrobia bacterium]|nr:MAG: hypothetical protein DME46_12280 [Verrucomicrobiota bacterium]